MASTGGRCEDQLGGGIACKAAEQRPLVQIGIARWQWNLPLIAPNSDGFPQNERPTQRIDAGVHGLLFNGPAEQARDRHPLRVTLAYLPFWASCDWCNRWDLGSGRSWMVERGGKEVGEPVPVALGFQRPLAAPSARLIPRNLQGFES